MALDRLKSTWEKLGRVDPRWAVLTDPDRRHGGWDTDEFLATAAAPIQRVRELTEAAGLSLGDRALDFGCGAGRLSNGLAAHVDTVVGVDIAQSMVDEAVKINRFPDRVSFTSYDGHRLPFDDESFDSVVSLISIQHSPPAVQLACLVEMHRVTRPGGVLVLQIPARPNKPTSLAAEAMRAGIEPLDAPGTVGAGQTVMVRAKITNLSSAVWPAGQLIRLGNHWRAGEEPVRWNDGRTDIPHDIAPGASVEMQVPVAAPDEPGSYVLELDLVQEAVSWFAEAGGTSVRVPVEVVAAPVAAPVVVAPTEESPAEPPAQGRDDGGMEMFGMDQNLVRLLFAHCGSDVVAAVPDDMAGSEWESYTYVIRRGATI
ncbi:methyltransferase domain-containing protein [Kutzneria kofuensis]|uniref:SAM-dependent methyltransferase n=1 Tax=Kutzneria kofuensis TaxID=103725 RepID=A0A7W9NK13_9PSEU|nr:methyltransferase domain-containing protein [Kutzneria kofuensis]MBB5895239.1 SAM-dependent methyltransferase [Kutzneria kofuensis]